MSPCVHLPATISDMVNLVPVQNLRKALGSAIEEVAWFAEEAASRTPHPFQDAAFTVSEAISAVTDAVQIVVGA